MFYMIYLEEFLLFDGIKKKIQSLNITLTKSNRRKSKENLSTVIFTNIWTKFPNLCYINCDSVFQSDIFRLYFDGITPTFFSSTLMKLHINVGYMDDCLHLLDGRFNQLETFHVNIDYVHGRSSPMINEKVGYFQPY